MQVATGSGPDALRNLQQAQQLNAHEEEIAALAGCSSQAKHGKRDLTLTMANVQQHTRSAGNINTVNYGIAPQNTAAPSVHTSEGRPCMDKCFHPSLMVVQPDSVMADWSDHSTQPHCSKIAC